MNTSSRTKVAWRLERLPSSSYFIFLGFMIVGTYFLESVDNGAIGYFLPYFTKEFGLNSAQSGLLGSVSSLGVIAGAIIALIFCDRIGRKKIIVVSMFVWGIFGVIMAAAGSLTVLIIARIGIGLGLGAQIPAATTLLSESIPAKKRAAYITVFMSCTPLGLAAAGLLSYFLIPSIGWRGVAVIESILSLTVFILIKYLPESALWLESRGRFEEADAVITKIESRVAKATGKELPPIQVLSEEEKPAANRTKIPLVELFSKKYVRSTIMVTLWWPAAMFVSIGLSTWFSSLMVAKGFTIIKSIGYTSVMYLGGLLGIPVVQFLLKRLGRKWTTVVMPIIIGVFAFCYGKSGNLGLMIVLGILYNCFVYGSAMTNNVYTPELYPTRIRGTALSYGSIFGRTGAFLGPTIIGMIVQSYGAPNVFPFVAAVCVFYGIWVALLGKETGECIFTE
ncbi:MFS transporter, putative metabolite:H+ symporter [Sporobacter termitidis DSM 10068]|uniref:MFS transporter, putative metabolite:H+ symporter n=1 Tax=Sporobacter termitidis DSM 10068 TaxID=1123282 RepID=A0A1M5X6F9_9FIRM|nr:MFS transporter [Sporobacter termitidis]SHH95381.1 MFS transporter, putative metabolite:H+ symporter [Sporobacter termitidis DSM 10068]